MLKLTVAHESWPIAGSFTISRGSKTSVDVVTVALEDETGAVGRGECVPYPRYGETADGVVAALEAGADDYLIKPVSTKELQLRVRAGERIVHCLRQLGMYGEVGRELARQVEVGGEKTEQEPEPVAAAAGESDEGGESASDG